ncbi:hypothetical protein JOD31_001620 [Methylopila capsulata]|uniref:Flagellar basal-body protein FlbY n=1 Tax=Methylopila capsulata TaxID=61654 RepID=A0A9W6IQ37_9HYPH|nr:hypothetical protein [Methylopila capsulata]MBM7851395.1 hypothetical protein [Methylopila capsulata]GLK54452.1 hypothetical protein GCM10008170_04710 [Methylopila capsulata]
MLSRRRSVPAVAKPQLTIAEAADRLARMSQTVARLTAVIVEETSLLKAGKYAAASALEARKGELSSRYVMDVDAVKASGDQVAAQPAEVLEEAEALHLAFRQALDENLAVLGVARSVAESLMRGVAQELAARNAPTTYDARGGAYGRPQAAAPMTLSRRS